LPVALNRTSIRDYSRCKRDEPGGQQVGVAFPRRPNCHYSPSSASE
jgi:hypothetical protein